MALVVGLGNELMGDDGIGIAVAERLDRTPGFSHEVRSVGVPGFNLLDLACDSASIVLIDAIDGGREPGDVFRALETDIPPTKTKRSLHQIGLEDLLRLWSFVEGAATPVLIGIQPRSVLPRMGLTPELGSHLAEITEATARLIREVDLD